MTLHIFLTWIKVQEILSMTLFDCKKKKTQEKFEDCFVNIGKFRVAFQIQYPFELNI